MNPNKAALCGVFASIAEKRGMKANQARDSKLKRGKISTKRIPLMAASRNGRGSLSVRIFTNTGLYCRVEDKVQHS